MRIRISSATVTLTVELNESPTAAALVKALPFSATVNTWGEEIYFATPVTAKLSADARADAAVGEVGYWPPGQALCVFFGRTPASTGSEPRAASPVNPVGRVVGDAKAAAQIHDGTSVTVLAGTQ
ncbi:MAG TPA: cyclophilin-like fold protein [Rhodocyclaceae bacterium]